MHLNTFFKAPVMFCTAVLRLEKRSEQIKTFFLVCSAVSTVNIHTGENSTLFCCIALNVQSAG